MSTRKHHLRPIAYNLSPAPQEYREHDGSPVGSSMRCPVCTETKHERFFAPRWSLGTSRGCISCTRAWFDQVTSAQLPGTKGKSDEWKLRNLHLYYEQAYREAASAADSPAIIHSFTMQELLWTYGNGRNECAAAPNCTGSWVGLHYRLAPSEGGSHSLENVRPACREHIGEGAL